MGCCTTKFVLFRSVPLTSDATWLSMCFSHQNTTDYWIQVVLKYNRYLYDIPKTYPSSSAKLSNIINQGVSTAVAVCNPKPAETDIFCLDISGIIESGQFNKQTCRITWRKASASVKTCRNGCTTCWTQQRASVKSRLLFQRIEVNTLFCPPWQTPLQRWYDSKKKTSTEPGGTKNTKQRPGCG